LQAALTPYYEDTKVVQGASGCHKTRMVKCQFKDQEDDACNEGADAADAAAAADAADASASAADAGAGAAGARAACGGQVPATPAQAPSPVWKVGALGAKKPNARQRRTRGGGKANACRRQGERV
jgi:hypothetical protein